MTADLAGELDRLDKAAQRAPWEHDKSEPGIWGPEEIIVGNYTAADDFDSPMWADIKPADAEFICWVRNHTDEIKAALADEGWDQAMADVYIAREHAALMAERDRLQRTLATNEDQRTRLREALEETTADRNRLRATVRRVELLADNGYEAHYDNPGAAERVCVDLADLRAALEGKE